MPKTQTNNLKWIAELLKIVETVDADTDRVGITYTPVREIAYNNIGITASDKFTFKDSQEIMQKIETRLDRSLERDPRAYRIHIADRTYNIERVFVREQDRVMELSLSYAN